MGHGRGGVGGLWLDTCQCVGGRKDVGDTGGYGLTHASVWVEGKTCGTQGGGGGGGGGGYGLTHSSVWVGRKM